MGRRRSTNRVLDNDELSGLVRGGGVMAIAVDDPRPSGIQRGRGGFMRSTDGKPYVTDPSGATTKHDGNKADLLKLCAERGIAVADKVTVAQLHELLGGRPKRLAYGSPSNRGMQIENSTNLTKWGERRVVLGVGLDPEIAASCAQLIGLDVDSEEYKTAADGIIARAKEIAKANLAAQQGTHVHALTEDSDEDRDWVRRAEAGEILGLDKDLQARLVAGWNRMLEREGLEVLAVEASCVDDKWRLAGTLDRIVRCTKPLRFARHGGEIVEIPAGEVPVLDVKTSSKRLDRNGCVQYWQAYAIQIASYAQSVPYDTETEQRGEWPWEISQQHALIAHPDLDTCEWELIYCDLAAGREHGGECVVSAKAWENRTDVFSVSQLDVPAEVSPVPASAGTTSSPVDVAPSDDEATAGAGEPALAPALIEPGQVPPASPARADHRVIDGPSPDRMALVDARAQLPTTVDEGADLSGAEYGEGWAVLQRHYNELNDAARSWLAYLIREATKRGLTFHAKHQRTLRCFELYRGLIFLCEAGGDKDPILRALLAIELGDVALYPAIHPGHLVGALDATAATRFADLVIAYNADELTSSVDDDGTLRLAAA